MSEAEFTEFQDLHDKVVVFFKEREAKLKVFTLPGMIANMGQRRHHLFELKDLT